jgi:hypothetical protein
MGYIKAMGANTVCIEIMSYTLGDYNDPNFYTLLDSMIASAKANNLYVYFRGFSVAGASLASCGYTWSSVITIFSTLATRYASYDGLIIYEPVSEYLNCDYATYTSAMQGVVDAVRAHSPNAIVSISAESSGDWPTTFNFLHSYPINRNNIIYSVDLYPWIPHPANDQASIWSLMWVNAGADWVLNTLGAPVICGEFGGAGEAYSSWDATWNQNFMTTSDSHGCSGYYAWRWITSSEECTTWALLANWNGGLSVSGNDIKTYYLTH